MSENNTDLSATRPAAQTAGATQSQASMVEIVRQENALGETLASIARKRDLMRQTMIALRDQAFSPDQTKQFTRRWRIGQVAKMVGRTAQAIRDKQREGKLSRPDDPRDYTLDDINEIRRVFGLLPWRAPHEEPVVLAFQTFKGGAGKSTLSSHLAQYLALKSYRVAIVDVDPQATTSMLLGAYPMVLQQLLPDAPSTPSLNDYMSGDIDEFASCVHKSYFPGIDIVPSGIMLNGSEYALASQVNTDPTVINRLRDGIRQIWHNYDVIIIDPPPALGLLSLNAMNAANALVIPVKPTLVDFASTWQFLEMVNDNLEVLSSRGMPAHYFFSTLVVNGFSESKSAQVEITEGMRQIFGDTDMVNVFMKDSAEIDNAAKEMRTVYDLSKPMTNREVHTRCVKYLDALNDALETRIRKTWPSHTDSLRKQARI